MERRLPAQPFDSSGDKPVYSCHRLFRNSLRSSARLHQASVGIASITCRSLTSDRAPCSSPSEPLSKSFAPGVDFRMCREGPPTFGRSPELGASRLVSETFTERLLSSPKLG